MQGTISSFNTVLVQILHPKSPDDSRQAKFFLLKTNPLSGSKKGSKYGADDVNELLFTSIFFIGGIMIGLVTVFNITKPFLHFN